MQSSLAISIGLPATLCIIMLGLGLSLRLDDFVRVLSRPWPVFVGIFTQVVLLPAVCLALVSIMDLPPSIRVGMMLLAASPAATSAVLYTHLARGDVALSITFAAVSTVVALASLPVIANLSLLIFYGETTDVRLDIAQVFQIFVIAIVPALIGAFIRGRRPDLATRLERPVKLLATLFLAVVVLFALISQWQVLLDWGPTVGVVVLVFNLASLAAGYWVARIAGINRPQTVALSMSVGIHNAALVIALAMSEFMLDNAEMAIPPAAYGLLAYITGAAMVWLLNRYSPDMASA